MKKLYFREWTVDSSRYWFVLAILAGFVALAGLSVLYMEHEGHWVTGMNQQIVWGMPHVFAIFLIVAASGALNVASIGSVFSKTAYKPLARLSGLLAITLLIGGLLVLVLDLGRPDRILVAMTEYNFKSIFAWNIYLYTGFMVIVGAYLFTMFERKAAAFNRPLGFAAFVWRLALTTGTGSIFGFLVSRQAYDAAIMAPMFIVMSFGFGLAIFILFLMFTFDQDDRDLGDRVVTRLKNLLGVFIAGALLLVIAYHLTKMYGTKNHGVETFILLEGGIYTKLFWFGQILIGSLLPLGILYHPSLGKSRGAIAAACMMVIFGGLSAIYVIVIGGQAFPMQMFPGKTIIESGFFDGVNGVAFQYAPSVPEFLLGIGGFAVAILAATIAVRLLKFLPATLSDAATDPHA